MGTIGEPCEEIMPLAMPGPPTNLVSAALVKAQSKFTAVEKSEKAEIPMKSGGKYSYTYAPLEAINAMIQRPLAENGLAHIAFLDEEMALHVRLLHSSGQYLESRIVMERNRDPKIFGGQTTYYKRILLSALLGISTEDSESDGPTPAVRGIPPKQPAKKKAAARKPPKPSPEHKLEPGTLAPGVAKAAVTAHTASLASIVGEDEAQAELKGIYNQCGLENGLAITTKEQLEEVVGKLQQTKLEIEKAMNGA